MYIDALLLIDNAHAYTAAAVSSSSVDLTSLTIMRSVGNGEPLVMAVSVDVAADCTTVKIEIIQTTGADLTGSVVVLAERTFLAADLPAGALVSLSVPQWEPVAGSTRYIGARITPSGGNATITCTTWFTARDLFSVKSKHYSKNYNV